MLNLKTYLLIGVLVITILLVAALAFFQRGKPQQLGQLPSSSPKPISTLNPTQKPVYNIQDSEKDYQRIISSKTLSPTDSNIRQELIGKAASSSGILNQNSNFKAEYVPGPDEFMVALLNTNAEVAKKSAHEWFFSLGLSQDGICHLPVVFYLGPEVSSYYRRNNLEFNPIPQGC